MKHVSHPSNTRTLGAPAGWNHDAVPCDALPITDMLAGGLPCVVSFWRPERAELEALIDGRPVVLSIMGQTMPPVILAVDVDQDTAPSASGGVLALVQQRLDERDEYFGHHQRPEPSDEERRTLRVLRQAECELRRFAEIRQAIHDYYLALDTRQHGGVAADRALDAVQRALGMQWRVGQELDRRAALAQPAPVQRDEWRGGSTYEASMLRNLLARIHGDGGHYVEQHGLDKALENADLLVATWKATPGQAGALQGMTDLLSRWEARSRDALPIDAMLVNKHIRELREVLAESTLREATSILSRREVIRYFLTPDEATRAEQLEDARDSSDAVALAAVMLERRRQVDVEGWTPEHDDEHVNDEIAAMACFYAMPPGAREWPATETGYGHTLGAAIVPEGWEAKEGDRWRELVKAGALILAEAARHYRAERKAQEAGARA